MTTRTPRATVTHKTRPSRWLQLKHPFRLFYFGIVFLLASLVAALLQVLLTPTAGNLPDLTSTYIWRVAEGHPAAFWSVIGVCLVFAGIGWLFDHQAAQHVSPHQSLTLARELRAASFKLGDDVA